jgi:hypothetical protein
MEDRKGFITGGLLRINRSMKQTTNKLLPILTFLSGITISGVAAYYSVVGLTTLFAGAFWSILIMGTALETGKLVAVSWLYNNWKIAPLLTRVYLFSAIIVLMLITSMGIFGFLSRAHIDQQLAVNTGVSEQIQIVDGKISIQQGVVDDIDKQIAVIDNSVNKLIEKGRATTSITINEQQKANRKALIDQKQKEVETLSSLKVEKIKLESENKKVEAEVGPIKYVAELIYGSDDTKVVDKAIRFVIIIIIAVFDPLAICLLLAFNVSVKNMSDDYGSLEYVTIADEEPKEEKKPRVKIRAKSIKS